MPSRTSCSRYGGWLPENPAVCRSFVETQARAAYNGGTYTAVVKAFAKVITDDPVMSDLMHQIFRQSDKLNKVRDFPTFLNLLDRIVQTAPAFYVAKGDDGSDLNEPIGVPMLLVFDLLSNTSAAYDLFRMRKFNAALKNLLNAWGAFLMTEASDVVLNTSIEGWFSSKAIALLEEGRGGSFNDIYAVPNPDAENRGFRSWDHFFTRPIRKDKRPVDCPDDKSLIHSACESTVYRIARNVQEHDKFWLKGQAYSLCDMLNHDNDYAAKFIGGTVYQAFLSPLDYHRWHAPVDGVIRKAVVVDGSYYAVIPDEGDKEPDGSLNPRGALIRSQAFLTMSAARALIFIEADNPAIGLMCFVAVGMAEVSTCDIAVAEGQRVKAGDELGMFHFGGSSHALVFRPETNITFADHVVEDQHLWVNSTIAHVDSGIDEGASWISRWLVSPARQGLNVLRNPFGASQKI